MQASAQDNVGDESTIQYSASYFTQYRPVTALDMINRIPGMNVQDSSASQGSNASRGGRGLGSGSGGTQILINGKRMAGKDNNAQAQLSRITADQVQTIEIIRGTGGELDVRGSTQIANIVLFETQSNSSVSYEVNAGHYHDSNTEPGGAIAYSRSTGNLNILLNASATPQYKSLDVYEESILGDITPNDIIKEERITEQTNYTYSANLDYQFGSNTSARVNALYAENDDPTTVDRLTVNLRNGAFDHFYQREDTPGTRSNWEIGGDFEHRFDSGSRFKALFITNENETASTRERYNVFTDGTEEKNLFLYSSNVITEDIFRTSYTMNLTASQDLEFGAEVANTMLDSSLLLGVRSSGVPSPDYGGLVPVAIPNTNTRVEEVRFEPFAIHNWQISSRMSLETSLLYETSEITQSGDFNNSRKFDFIKPKLDYRFDITPQLQLRFMVEKNVRQINFVDFVAVTDTEDEDSNTLAGNVNLRPDYWWNYNLLTEYRLPNDAGVVSANLYKHHHVDFRQRIDVSRSEDQLRSAVGNLGNGDMVVLDLKGSIRMKVIDMPNLLVTSRFSIRDSEISDPFVDGERSFNTFERGRFELGFRQDIIRWRMNYGVNWTNRFDGDYKRWDIDDIEAVSTEPEMTAFLEIIRLNNTSFRFDVSNALDTPQCRDRERYLGRVRDGILEELEQRCTTSGRIITFKVSGTF